MSDSAGAQSEAAKRAAARKAKILARGNTGLQKLAQTARGDEAEKLYGGDSASSSRPITPSAAPPRSDSTPSWIPPTAPSAPGSDAGIPADQQQMAAQMQAMMAMLGGGGPGGPGAGGAEGMPDMSNLLAQMMGGGGGPGAGGPNLLGGLNDPSAAEGPGANPFGTDGSGMPNFPDLSQLANMGMGMGMPQQGKGWVERSFPLIHALGVLALLAFVVGWWEPSMRFARWAGAVDSGVVGRWARLAGRRGGWGGAKSGLLGDVESLPLFWGFTTLELILQTTRFIILKSPPPPHSLISTFLPMLPPKISRPLLTGSRYLTMLTQIYKDGCLLIFGVGVFIILSEYLSV